jgi:hypothetical protein
LQLAEEMLIREVRALIGFYVVAAHERHISELLLAHLEEVKEQIMGLVETHIQAQRSKNQRDWAMAGVSPATLPSEYAYLSIKTRALDVVNAELGVLEAESRFGEGISSQVNSAKSNGQERKRGPKPDHEGAARVREIVAHVAPDGDWRSKLDAICEALDAEKVPAPRPWWTRQEWLKATEPDDGPKWQDYPERGTAVKAIEYRLEKAEQRKKATPETLS